MLNRRLLRRLRRRAWSGLSVWGAVLAVGLVAGGVAAWTTWLQAERASARAERAARQMGLVAAAAREHAYADFATLLAAGNREIPFASISPLLPDGFAASDALGRTFRILKRPATADAFRLLVTHTVPAGDPVTPAAGLLAPAGAERIGMVRPGTLRLTGPAVDADLSAWRTAFTGAAPARALATLLRVDRDGVCGPWLHRTATPACPDGQTMETALDMNGNAVANAGAVGADTVTVTRGLAVGGTATISGALTVSRSLDVTGDLDATGALTAASAALTGSATAGSMAVTNALNVGTSLTVAGTASAARVASSGTLSAAGLTSTAATVSGTLTVGNCSGC